MAKLWLAVGGIAFACGMVWAAKAHPPKVDAEKIRAHVRYLASDELEGRGTGQKGCSRAGGDIAGKFKRSGLLPGGESGDSFQSVPLVGGKSRTEGLFVL